MLRNKMGHMGLRKLVGFNEQMDWALKLATAIIEEAGTDPDTVALQASGQFIRISGKRPPERDDDFIFTSNQGAALQLLQYAEQCEEKLDHFVQALVDQTEDGEIINKNLRDLEEVLRFAHHIGRLTAEIELRSEWEKRACRSEAGGRLANQRITRYRPEVLKKAVELWAEVPTKNLTDMATFLRHELKEAHPKAKTPAESTIRKWLKAAGKKGEITIPQAAASPGRPSNA